MALAERTAGSRRTSRPSRAARRSCTATSPSDVPLEQAYSRRRVAALRQADAASRSCCSPGHTDTVPAQGNLPGRIEDGVGRRPRGQRHEGRARRDDRARPLGGEHRARATTSALLFFPREELGPAENPLPGVFERTGAGRRGAARHLPRADRQHAAARLPRQPERARRLRGTLRALRAAVARRERDRRRLRRAADRCSTPSRATSRSRACCSAR